MKIIDLWNKIANDGKIPERIKFNEYEYRYHDKEHGYCRSNYDCTYICLDSEYYLFDILNDEVEILEEEKKIPEKLNKQHFHKKQRQLANKINEIIDYLEYLKNKGDE